MADTTANRGRKNTTGRGTGFFQRGRAKSSDRRKAEQAAKDTQIAEEVKTMNPDPAPKARTNFVETGKAFFNKFVDGYRKPERANVIGDFDDNCIDRIATPYINKLSNDLQNSKSINDDLKEQLPSFYRGYIYLSAGIKLMLSSTEEAKGKFRRYSDLARMQLRLPLKLTEQLDQLGKTDLDGNNIFRIKNQTAMAARMLLKSCAVIFSSNVFNNGNVYGSSTDWQTFYGGYLFDRCYTNDQTGVEYIHDECRKIARDLLDRTWHRKIPNSTNTWLARLPQLDIESEDLAILFKWCEGLYEFTHWIFTENGSSDGPDITNQVIGSIIGCFVTRQWIRRRAETLDKIDARFENTAFAKYKPVEIFKHLKLYCIEEILSYDDLIDNVFYIQQLYSERYNGIVEKSFNLRDIKFKETGTAAQLVLNSDEFIERSNENFVYKEIKSDYVPHLYDKIDYNLAGFGLISNFMKKVEMKKDWVINYNGKIQDIRDQYVKSDFK